MSTHNICFYGELIKLSFSYHQIPILSVPLQCYLFGFCNVTTEIPEVSLVSLNCSHFNTASLYEHTESVTVQLESISVMKGSGATMSSCS